MLVMMMIMMIRVVIVMMTMMMMIMVPTFASPLSDRQNIFLALVECKLQTRETIFVKITYSWLYRSNFCTSSGFGLTFSTPLITLFVLLGLQKNGDMLFSNESSCSGKG